MFPKPFKSPNRQNTFGARSRTKSNETGKKNGDKAEQTSNQTSTPNRDDPPDLDLSTISNISHFQQEPSSYGQMLNSSVTFRRNLLPNLNTSVRKVAPQQGNKIIQPSSSKKKSKAEEDENLKFRIAHNLLIQSMVINKLVEKNKVRCEDEVSEQLAALQRRISENQDILNKTKEHIKQLEVNRDIENLLEQNKNNFKDITNSISRLNSTDDQKRKEAVIKELEKLNNKITCENIAIPVTSSKIVEFSEVMKATSSAYEKLAKEPLGTVNETNEMADVLKQFDSLENLLMEVRKGCVETLSSSSSAVIENCAEKINDELIEEYK